MLFSLFSSVAFAQDGGSTFSSASSLFTSMMPIILIMVVFYFLLIRPQQKKMKQHQSMLSDLKKGDKVIISGGIFASIAKMDESSDTVSVEIAENVKIKIKRDSVLELIKPETSVAKKEIKKEKDVKKGDIIQKDAKD